MSHSENRLRASQEGPLPHDKEKSNTTEQVIGEGKLGIISNEEDVSFTVSIQQIWFIYAKVISTGMLLADYRCEARTHQARAEICCPRSRHQCDR